MAVSNGNLNLISDIIDSSQQNLTNYHHQIEECIEKLNADVNYKDFIANTDIGNELNQKILRLREIGDNASMDIARLLKTTNDFVERQRALNSQQSSYQESSYEAPSSTSTSVYDSKVDWYKNYYGGGSV